MGRIGAHCVVESPCRLDAQTRLQGHNLICVRSNLRSTEVGTGSYVGEDCSLPRCQIGRYSSIGPRVHLVVGEHPTHTFVSTHPAFYSTRNQVGFAYVGEQAFDEFRFANPVARIYVEIGNDVWIGADARIRAGVRIGDGAIVASGAWVTQDVAPFTIVGGLPAKLIRNRFSQEQTAYLQRLRWWDQTEEWIRARAHLFQNIDNLIQAEPR